MNPEYFKQDADRTRTWRRHHPGYWQRERRKAFTVEILLPVHRGGGNTVGMRFRDLQGSTLRHVVLAKTPGWLGVWREVGLTLQNVVHELGAARLSWAP
jgi:hypothetical protein